MDVDGLDITQLRLLEALAQTFHLSDAAARVGISPSAASHALARLRHDLRDPLFVRTSRGMRPTPYGERLSELRGARARRASERPGNPERRSTRVLRDERSPSYLPTWARSTSCPSSSNGWLSMRRA